MTDVLHPRDVPQIALCAKPVAHQIRAMEALRILLTGRGYRVRETLDWTAPESIVVVWSWGKAMIVRSKNPSAIILTMDHGYTKNRAQLVNTGWSTPDMPFGLNGAAEHAVVDDGGERLRSKGWDSYLMPKRCVVAGRSNVLLLGQVFGDAMLLGQNVDYGAFMRTLRDEWTMRGYKTFFRPHPVMVRRGTVNAYGNLGRLSAHKDLYDAFSEMDACAAHSSNSLVEAFLYGLPVQMWNHGSMLWPIRGKDTMASFEKRERWFQRLAYTQWTNEELADGTWFKYHEPILHRLVSGGKAQPWSETTYE